MTMNIDGVMSDDEFSDRAEDILLRLARAIPMAGFDDGSVMCLYCQEYDTDPVNINHKDDCIYVEIIDLLEDTGIELDEEDD